MSTFSVRALTTVQQTRLELRRKRRTPPSGVGSETFV